MHELSVTEGILNFALEEAKKRNAEKVTAIHLRLGSLSGLVPDCIGYYFELIAEGTLCEGAQLRFERIPAKIHCLDCKKEQAIEGFRLICPTCASRKVELISGREAYIDSMEIENGNQSRTSDS